MFREQESQFLFDPFLSMISQQILIKILLAQ